MDVLQTMPFIPDDRVCLLLMQEEEVQGEETKERDEECGEVQGQSDESEGWFYLDIPLNSIDSLCLTPRKYLLYLGWCILGLDANAESLTLGLAGEDGVFRPIENDGELEGGGIYHLIFNDPRPGMYSSVPHERAVLIHCRHGCSGHRGRQGADDRTF